MTYVFDIDGTICHSDDGYENSKPILDRIEKINKLYESGHTIYFLTARGMGRSNNKKPLLFEDLTKKQLEKWGVKYHNLFMGKPSGSLYIDDKGIKDEDFFDSKN
tara:strand:- start:15196 stop:15510 length:315 start_codon:yes stop_codon:yes gene_type:complete